MPVKRPKSVYKISAEIKTISCRKTFSMIPLPSPLLKTPETECTPYVEHDVKSVPIWSYSGPHYPTFRRNTKRYGISLLIQSECGKMRTKITSNTNNFHAVECT